MISKTNSELIEFFNTGAAWLGRKENQAETKFRYALIRMTKRVGKVIEKYNDELEDARIEHCSVDDKGIIQRDAVGRYQFTKEGLGKLNKFQRELNAKKVEIEPYIATEVATDLVDLDREVFVDFLIKPDASDDHRTTADV